MPRTTSKRGDETKQLLERMEASNSRAQSMRQRFAHSRYPTSTSAQVTRKSSLLNRGELSALLANQPRHVAYSLDVSSNARLQHDIDLDVIKSPVRSKGLAHATGERQGSPPSPPPPVGTPTPSSPPSPPAAAMIQGRSPPFNQNWNTRLGTCRPSANCSSTTRPPTCRLTPSEPDAAASCCAHVTNSTSPTQDRSTLQLPPTTKTNLSRRGLLANFKSKSLDLLGTSRIQHIQQQLQSRLNRRQWDNELHPDATEAASSSSVTPQSTPKSAERRRRLFLRKQTNSAPDSFESPVNSRSSSVESQCSIVYRGLESALRTSALFTWNSIESHTIPSNQPSFIELLEDQLKSGPELTRIEHLSDLHYPDADPPCHFCSNQSSLSIHDSNRLKIVSGGRIRGRDGSRDSINPPYINLPSPNVQEDEQETDSRLFPGSSPVSSSSKSTCRHHPNHNDNEEEQPEPPASVLTRRRALVPPKIPPYNLDSSEEAEHSADKEASNSCAESDPCGPRTRRSSIVVIPPMQICPGDLLVYSKVLTQRSSLLADWEGSTQSLSGEADAANARKHKNSWSLLKLFDRSGRAKSESLSGLEEVLTCLQPTVFCDDQLSRYRGLCWSDFLQLLFKQTTDKATKVTLITGINQDRFLERTGLPSAGSRVPPSSRILTRQSTQQDYSSRLKEWTLEKRARFGLVRTMSERSLDRKLIREESQTQDSPPVYASVAPPVYATSTTTTTTSTATAAASAAATATTQAAPTPVDECDNENGEDEEAADGASSASPMSTQKSEQRRKEALWDLFQSECAFLYDHLMVLKNVYMDPLKKIQVEGYAMFAEPELLFGNLDELCCVTYSFCKEFITLLLHHAQPSGETSTADILTKLFQKSSQAHNLSQAYHRYALNYINALNYLETLRRHMEFCEFEKWCNRDPRCKKLQLTDLLVAPVQHIMKIPLLLREIEARTEDAADKETVLKILDMEEASIRELDDKMKWLKNFERLLEIQRSLVWPSVLDLEPKIVVPEFLKTPLAKQPCERLIVSPRRQIVIEGPLNLLDSGRPCDMHVILFDDMLLITRKKKGLGKKKSTLGENWPAACSRSCLNPDPMAWRYIVYKQPLSLDRFFLHEINANEAATAKLENGFVIISLNRFQQIIGVHTFQASSEQVKQTWLAKLRETQERWKRTLQTTVFRSQRTLSPSCSIPNPSSSAKRSHSVKSEVKSEYRAGL